MVLNITAEQLGNIKKEQKKFISETADSLKESIHASVNNHIQSLDNVYSLTHKLGKKLNEETSTLINQYETERLRSFGRFRINLDSTMRSMKEEIIRNLRIKLGFTPIGEPIFSEREPIPTLPSAVYMAEMFNNTRKIIDRGFTNLANRTKEIMDENIEKNSSDLNQLKTSTCEQFNNFSQEIESKTKEQKKNIESLMILLKEKLSLTDQDTLMALNQSEMEVLSLLNQNHKELLHNTNLILNEFLRKRAKITSQALKSISSFVNKFEEDFKRFFSITKKERVTKLSNLISTDLNYSINLSKQYNSVIKSNTSTVNRLKKNSKTKFEDISKLQKDLEMELSKVLKIVEQDPENRFTENLRKITEITHLLDIKIDSIKEEIDQSSTQFNDISQLSESILNKHEKQLKRIEKREEELDEILWQLFSSQAESLFQKVTSSFKQIIQKIGLEISELNLDIENQITSLVEDTKTDIQRNYSSIEENIKHLFANQTDSWSSHHKLISNNLLDFSSNIEQVFSSILKNNSELFLQIKEEIEHSLTKIVNTQEVNLAQLFESLKNIFSELSLSVINRLNDFENKLGDEYEAIIDYFEKAKETTLGTAKTLLDDLSEYLKKSVDVIWTSVLKQFNSLQEHTSSSSLEKKMKYIVRTTYSEIEKNIEEKNKEANDLLMIFSDSIRVTFEELIKSFDKAFEKLSNSLSDE
ncbi:MAG: hypothetical protein ACTSRR_05775 [Candidatus Heimdallarchaeaceae archaeon]